MPERKKQSISFIHRENKLHLNYLEMGVIFKKKKNHIMPEGIEIA